MLLNKESIMTYLQESLFQKNYSLSNASKRYFGLDSLVFQCANNAANRDLIKVEINYLDRAHIFPIERKTVNALGYKGDTPISVLNEYELFGSKLAALVSRCKPRDAYDTYKMIQSHSLEDEEMLKKCLIYYNCVGGEADILSFNLDKLNSLSKRDFDRMLRPMLSKNERFDRRLAIEEIQKYLGALLHFTSDETAFINEFKNKTYKPELLFEDQDVITRLLNHPMAIWKCATAKGEE